MPGVCSEEVNEKRKDRGKLEGRVNYEILVLMPNYDKK
jgi:hypothetical protein